MHKARHAVRPAGAARKILVALVALGAIWGMSASPVQAEAPTIITAQSVAEPAPKAEAVERDTKMGALPYQWQVCVANGIIGYNTEWVLEKWTQASYGALQLVVRNRCYEDYSITNRLTVDTYIDGAATAPCGKFSNLGKYWDPSQQKYIWNQNPVVWLNVADKCVPTDTTYAHRLAMYVGYILGLNYVTAHYYVMGTTSYALENVKYVTNQDRIWMAGVYGLAA